MKPCAEEGAPKPPSVFQRAYSSVASHSPMALMASLEHETFEWCDAPSDSLLCFYALFKSVLALRHFKTVRGFRRILQNSKSDLGKFRSCLLKFLQTMNLADVPLSRRGLVQGGGCNQKKPDSLLPLLELGDQFSN